MICTSVLPRWTHPLRRRPRRRKAVQRGVVILIFLATCIEIVAMCKWYFALSDLGDGSFASDLLGDDRFESTLLGQLSMKIPPIKSKIDGKIVIPSVNMALLDGMQNCALPTDEENYCDKYRNGSADPHVVQVIMTVLRHRCNPKGNVTEAPLVWDLGSNIGQFSLYMRAMGCRVVAIDPQPSMNWFHKASQQVNGWHQDGSIVLHESAVSDTKGKITLTKLWQPGNKNAGKMTVDSITIKQLADSNKQQVVELVKLDIDGPELYTLRGLADLLSYQQVKNIIVELSVKFWGKMGFDDDVVSELFSTFYKDGYRMFLVFEQEFSKYPKATMDRLIRVENLGELRLSYEVPHALMMEVLTMANRVTKNIFMTKDPAVLKLVQ